jgi:NDP-sugar pyrophosphorylase family protein
VTGHLSKVVDDYIGDSFSSFPVTIVRQEGGTAPALLSGLIAALPFQSSLCLNGDTILDINYSNIIKAHQRYGSVVTLVTTDLPDAPNHGSILVKSDGIIVSFNESSETSYVSQDNLLGYRCVSNCGAYCFSNNEMISFLKQVSGSSFEKDVLPAMTKQTPVKAISNGLKMFLDFGTPERYAQATHRCNEIKKIYYIQ